jgi:hypothetical protein
MDSDSKRQINKNSHGNNSVNAGNILQPTRVRCPIRLCYEVDRFLLDYGFNFLPYVSFIVYAILLLKEAF